MSRDFSQIPPERARVLLELAQGKRKLCWHCCGAVPLAELRVIGVLASGGPRYLCNDCANEERNYARTPAEECEHCGSLRKQEGSSLCRACEVEQSEAS